MIDGEDYSTILQQNSLTEDDLKKLSFYEDYIKRAKYYLPYLNDEAKTNVEAFDRFFSNAQVLPNLSATFQGKIGMYNVEIAPVKNKLEEQYEQERQKEMELVLKKEREGAKAGYANALALLFVILNLGLFLAGVLLFLQ